MATTNKLSGPVVLATLLLGSGVLAGHLGKGNQTVVVRCDSSTSNAQVEADAYLVLVSGEKSWRRGLKVLGQQCGDDKLNCALLVLVNNNGVLPGDGQRELEAKLHETRSEAPQPNPPLVKLLASEWLGVQ